MILSDQYRKISIYENVKSHTITNSGNAQNELICTNHQKLDISKEDCKQYNCSQIQSEYLLSDRYIEI